MRLRGRERPWRYEDIQALPTHLHDRGWRAARLAAAAVPPLIVVRQGPSDPWSAPGVLRLLLAVLILVRVLTGERRMRAISRAVRRRQCRTEALLLLAGTGLATLLPPGRAAPSPGEAVVSVAAGAAVTVFGCLREFRTWPQVGGVSSPWVRGFGCLRTWSCHGWTPALIAVVQPDAGALLPAATAMTVLESASPSSRCGAATGPCARTRRSRSSRRGSPATVSPSASTRSCTSGGGKRRHAHRTSPTWRCGNCGCATVNCCPPARHTLPCRWSGGP